MKFSPPRNWNYLDVLIGVVVGIVLLKVLFLAFPMFALWFVFAGMEL